MAQIKQGFTNAFTINFGTGGNIGDLLGRLLGVAEKVGDIFFRVLTPAVDALKKSFEASAPLFDKLLQQLGPLLINAVQALAIGLGILAGIFVAVLSGVMQAVAFAIPFIIQLFISICTIYGDNQLQQTWFLSRSFFGG